MILLYKVGKSIYNFLFVFYHWIFLKNIFKFFIQELLKGADFGYMDIDSTTIAKVKATVDQTITKKSDGNHTRKDFHAAP